MPRGERRELLLHITDPAYRVDGQSVVYFAREGTQYEGGPLGAFFATSKTRLHYGQENGWAPYSVIERA